MTELWVSSKETSTTLVTFRRREREGDSSVNLSKERLKNKYCLFFFFSSLLLRQSQCTTKCGYLRLRYLERVWARESALHDVALCNSTLSHSRSLGLSLSHSSSNIWQLVFDVDHKTTVSWQMGKMQTLRTDSKKRPNARATILNFEGVATPPRHCRSPQNGDLCFLWASITRLARGQRAARSEGQLTVQVSISLFFVSLFFSH